MLLRVYSQNIDGLERIAGLSDSFLVESHGSFASASCIECGFDYPLLQLKYDIVHGCCFAQNSCIERIPRCKCGNLVKPDIVFYGEPLPVRYTWMHTADMVSCDMLLVIGTSLSVQPFSSLIHQVRENVPRVLINKEAVGPFRFCNMSCCFRDVLIQGDCDEGVKALCAELGWMEELEALYENGRSEPILGLESIEAEEEVKDRKPRKRKETL